MKVQANTPEDAVNIVNEIGREFPSFTITAVEEDPEVPDTDVLVTQEISETENSQSDLFDNIPTPPKEKMN